MLLEDERLDVLDDDSEDELERECELEDELSELVLLEDNVELELLLLLDSDS